jgi:hypothetical protein
VGIGDTIIRAASGGCVNGNFLKDLDFVKLRIRFFLRCQQLA